MRNFYTDKVIGKEQVHYDAHEIYHDHDQIEYTTDGRVVANRIDHVPEVGSML